MRRGRALGGGAAILAAALALGPARAQDASGQSLYSEGLSAYEAGDLSVACERFRKSFELDERPYLAIGSGSWATTDAFLAGLDRIPEGGHLFVFALPES